MINGPSSSVATAKSVVEISPPRLGCQLWSREEFLAAEGVAMARKVVEFSPPRLRHRPPVGHSTVMTDLAC